MERLKTVHRTYSTTDGWDVAPSALCRDYSAPGIHYEDPRPERTTCPKCLEIVAKCEK